MQFHRYGLQIAPPPSRSLFRFVRVDGTYQTKWRRVPIDPDEELLPGPADLIHLGNDYRIEIREADA